MPDPMPKPAPIHYFSPEQAKKEAELLQHRLSADPPKAGAAAGPAQKQAAAGGNDTSAQTISGSLGLALSGGGIRSATFNLGMLQALAGKGLLTSFGYLSTVSGGGYIGSFLGRLYHRAREEKAQASPLAVAQDVERKLASDEAPIIRWLRDNGRYLAPHGAKDRRFAAAIYLRNLLSVHVFLAVIFFSAFMLLTWLRSCFTATTAPDLVQASEPHYEAGPLWGLAVVLLMLFISSAWSYWMIRRDKGCAWFQVFIALVLTVSPLAILWFTDAGCPAFGGPLATFWGDCQPRGRGLLMLAGTALATLPILLITRLRSDSLAHARNRLSNLSSRLLLCLFATAGLALLDDLALLTLRVVENKTDLPLLGAGLTGALLAALRTLATHLSSGVNKLGNSTAGRGLKGIIGVIGIALMTLVAFGWAVAAYGVAGSKLTQQIDLNWLALAAALILFLMFVIYRGNLDFLNLSSLHQFYAARLTRAYLGAGNRKRDIAWTETPVRGSGQRPVSDVVEGDDMPMWPSEQKDKTAYAPHLHGGPLHLINVNVNQTRYSATGNFQPDRKGWNMAVGPAGLNLGRTFWRKAGWPGAEALSLGCWVSISGAAFSTGAGPRTGLGFSALLGLLGVRLGYWWRSGSGQETTTPTTAGALMDEFTGSFNPDQYRYWYLSDGGHFENTAAYELIRRKLKQIVVADCGADPGYDFDDITNLVLKARIDFDAEIEFFGDADLDALWSHTPWRATFFAPALGGSRNGAPLALARVRYRDDPEPGWLLVVKPRLLQDLPADLAHYADSAPDFPQQSTADQFYDEAQWESTRKLGRLIGGLLAGPLQALTLAWPNYLANQPDFEGTDWSRPPPKEKEDAPKPAGTAKLIALYTPLVIALWTGFEFYSNYQKSQATAAEERVKFVLSRLDLLEQRINQKPGCGAGATDCPTAAGQLEMLRTELTDLARIKPEKAKFLLEITDKLASALGLNRPPASDATTLASTQGTPVSAGATAGSPTPAPPPEPPATTPEPAPPPPPPPPPPPAPQPTDIARALVYLQIYTEDSRPRAESLITALQAAGMLGTQLPGIENVTRSAQARGRKPPARVARPTVIYYHPEDRELAEWIMRKGLDGQVDLRDLSQSYRNIRPGMVEIWLP